MQGTMKVSLQFFFALDFLVTIFLVYHERDYRFEIELEKQAWFPSPNDDTTEGDKTE